MSEDYKFVFNLKHGVYYLLSAISGLGHEKILKVTDLIIVDPPVLIMFDGFQLWLPETHHSSLSRGPIFSIRIVPLIEGVGAPFFLHFYSIIGT